MCTPYLSGKKVKTESFAYLREINNNLLPIFVTNYYCVLHDLDISWHIQRALPCRDGIPGKGCGGKRRPPHEEQPLGAFRRVIADPLS